MAQLKALKNFAKAKLNVLERRCPLYTWDEKDFEDPVKINAIYSAAEWQLDGPAKNLEERQDWIHLFACDPSSQTSFEIHFDRRREGVAFVWVKLKVDGKLFILEETCFKDYSDSDLAIYNAGGVRLECAGPMRSWRVAFNLMMREPNKPDDNRVHVRFGGRLTMTGHTFEIPKQLPAAFVARRFETENSIEAAKAAISKSCSILQALCQPICVYCEIIIHGERQETLLFGSRLKFVGNSNILQDSRHHIGYAENGIVFHVIESTNGHCYGYRYYTDLYVRSIQKGSFQRDQTNGLMKLTFKCGHISSNVVMRLRDSLSPQKDWTVNEFEGEISFSNKTHKLCGVSFELRKNYDVSPKKLSLCNMLQYPSISHNKEVLSIFEANCKNPSLTGGKGSSLAVLASISKSLTTFTVPAAVVLTVGAYEVFASTASVKNLMDEFIHDTQTTDLAKLKYASEKCVAALTEISFPESLKYKLLPKIEECFGSNWNSKKFAVRSSAVGEDSEEMSAAGQMTTYLGIKSEEQIYKSIVKCWASQFALTAVNYKRQYGQKLDSAMAVVVQEMVSPDSAGVMFTCNPVTSNPSFISLTANFGLGESVVSAAADPDTYTLQKLQGQIHLVDKVCGTKDRMIVETDTDGTEEKILEVDQSRKFCLTDEQAIKIASIGDSISDISDSPRDMEWAVIGEQVYLLQSRPVTSFLKESDFEIRHDANSSMNTKRDILSRGNIDEVMPGAFSQLGLSVMGCIVFETYSKHQLTKLFPSSLDTSQYIYTQALCCGKQGYQNFSNNAFATQKSFIKTARVTTFGYDISKDEVYQKGIIHSLHQSKLDSLKMISWIIKACRELKQTVDEARGVSAKLKIVIPQEGNSLELYTSFLSQLHKAFEGMKYLMKGSMVSVLFNVITLNVLKSSQGEKEYTADMMVLLSKLLRSDYLVESAEIPRELSQLSERISNDPKGKLFSDMSPEEALEWLETDNGEAAKDFRRLREKHAHRCYKEFDLNSKTWDIAPIPLVKTLQATVKAGDPPKKKEDIDRITVDDLPKRPSLMQRKILNFIIPRTQEAVYCREATKSVLVKYIHQARLAVRRVGQQLVAEGRLPDAELIFFLSLDEIYRLITTRNPYLLQRAIRRSKMHPKLDKEKFPVLQCGMPRPIESTKVSIDPNAVSMRGTPVSEGVVVGVARVIQDFENEAHLIEKGDILVTQATDTGWTPYFPLLGGVVTEIGGLLSHGAVVAREYGLPAVVGIIGATRFVKSGDIVTLDGNTGVFAKNCENASNGLDVEK